jgi:hypothetical protein
MIFNCLWVALVALLGLAVFLVPVYQKRLSNRELIVRRMWIIRACEGQWLEFTCVRVRRRT